MTTRAQCNDIAHGKVPVGDSAGWNAHHTTTDTILSRDFSQETCKYRCTASAKAGAGNALRSAPSFPFRSSSLCPTSRGRLSCALCTGRAPRAREGSTVRICSRRSHSENLSEFSTEARTEMSGQSHASMATAFTLPSWREWRGHRRLKPILPSSPVMSRAPVAAGSPTIPSRRPKHWRPCSPRSCVGPTSEAD